MNFLHDNKRTLLFPLLIGVSIGCLLIADPYIARFLSTSVPLMQHVRIFPFGLSLIIFMLFAAAFVFMLYFNKMNLLLIEKRDKIFIVLLILGLHSAGLIPGKLDTSDLLFGIFIVWWLMNIFIKKRYEVVTSPLNLLNLGLFLFAVLSVVNGGFGAMFGMLPMIKAMVICFFIIDIVRKKELVVFFTKTLFVVTVISAVIGIMQEIIFLLTDRIIVEIDPKMMKLVMESTPFGTFFRIPAYTGMHLLLANYLVLSLLIALNAFFFLSDRLTDKERSFLKISVVLLSVALALTFSKTNMLGLAAGITLSVCIRWRHRLIHMAMLLMLVLSATFYFGLWHKAYELIVADLESNGDIGLRVELMKRGVEGFFQKYPLLGAGVGRGKDYTQDVMEWGAHNAFIRAADDVGIFGFLFFLSIFIYAFIRLLSALASVKELEERALLITLLAGFTAYFINIQFQPDFLSYYNWIFIGYIESTVLVFRRGIQKPASYGLALAR